LIQVKETSTGNSFKAYFLDGTKFFEDVSAPKAINVFSSPTIVGNTKYMQVQAV
jgi:hypothetical protein